MAFNIFLVESIDVNNYVELDTEDIDVSATFQVADAADIANRKDTITRNIDFKGSSVNNQAFGNFYHLNRTSNLTLSNKLFFNYNPLRSVDCFIYEDGMLILKGSMMLTEVNVDKNGNVTYSTVVTGSFIDLKNILGDKLTDVLDFSHLQHFYTWDNIFSSWEQKVETYDPVNDIYYYTAAVKGKNYVYPYVDYGNLFMSQTENASHANIHQNNFRPAIYVGEYFNSIFSQTGLTGYSYEIRGDQSTIDKFNSMVILNNEQDLTTKFLDKYKTHLTRQGTNVSQGELNTIIHTALSMTGLSADPSQNLLQRYGDTNNNLYNCIYTVTRTFNSSAFVSVTMDFYNQSQYQMNFAVQLATRDFVASSDANFHDISSFSTVAESRILIPGWGGVNGQTFEFFVGEADYKIGSQLMLRLEVSPAEQIPSFNDAVASWTTVEADLKFAKDDFSYITVHVGEGDVFRPQPLQGVKQMDFMKSIIQLFNFYVYSEKDRPKHLIFERYDDYYALMEADLLPSVAIDWTRKVDFTNGWKLTPNINLPKSYNFTFKSDSDYLNETYQTLIGEPYASFTFNDSLGVADTNTVESVFSASPLYTFLGTGRLHPSVVKVDGNQRTTTKSNPRFAIYNGVKSCNAYNVGTDLLSTTNFVGQYFRSGLTLYPQCGNYIYGEGVANMTPLEDVYWSHPREYFIPVNQDILNAPGAYQKNYVGKITDMTNPNVRTVQCDAYLTEMDISNLDLKTPVFIDMGPKGQAYFRVLEVQYNSNTQTSQVTLQQIVIN